MDVEGLALLMTCFHSHQTKQKIVDSGIYEKNGFCKQKRNDYLFATLLYIPGGVTMQYILSLFTSTKRRLTIGYGI